jgi:GTPase Era involved in 16S rRNA processing
VTQPVRPITAAAAAPIAPLDRLTALACEAGALEIASDALALAKRLGEGRFYVACLGQFKRGKSTLLNALIGEPVLPTGVAPVTSVITVLRYGSRLTARVRFHGGDWTMIDPPTLSAYVSESENPGNAKAIEGAEVFVPSPLLARGMCLVDTPGIGSTFPSNTAVTRAFVPHIDAALVVLGADPPISNDELGLIADVAARLDSLIFVLNKADRLSGAERREARTFMQRVLAHRLGGQAPAFIEVSAKEQLDRASDQRDWPLLTAKLEELTRDAGSTLIEAAEARGLATLLERLRRDLDEQQRALVQPLDESERRIAQLRKAASEAERAMLELRHLLDAEQDRLVERLMAQSDVFLGRALPGAHSELATALGDLRDVRSHDFRQRSFARAQEIHRRWLDRWRSEEQPAAEHLYTELAHRFVELANDFLERVPIEDGRPACRITTETGFRTRSRLQYTEMLHLTSRGPLEWIVQPFRSQQRAQRAVEHEIGVYLERLIRTNASRLIHDLRDRVAESRRRLEADIRASLKEVHTSAERALERAREHHASGAEAVQQRLQRIVELQRRSKAFHSECSPK